VGAEPVMYMPCRNIQDELHAADPKRYPRTSATAYAIDSAENAAIEKSAEEAGLRIIAIVHSHPDHEAYFSDEDKANAAPWGEPLFPGVSYVVVSVFEKNVKALNEFYWDEKAKEFMERKIQF
jgi:proteasome lid subunit RPN8/RPN11